MVCACSRIVPDDSENVNHILSDLARYPGTTRIASCSCRDPDDPVMGTLSEPDDAEDEHSPATPNSTVGVSIPPDSSAGIVRIASSDCIMPQDSDVAQRPRPEDTKAGRGQTLANCTPEEPSTSTAVVQMASHSRTTPQASKPTVSDPELEELRRRLYNLPQELYDMIVEETFALNSDTIDSPDRFISDQYTLPWQLRINRHHRQIFMQHYYGGTALWTVNPKDYPTILYRWLDSLSLEALELLVLVKVNFHGPEAN